MTAARCALAAGICVAAAAALWSVAARLRRAAVYAGVVGTIGATHVQLSADVQHAALAQGSTIASMLDARVHASVLDPRAQEVECLATVELVRAARVARQLGLRDPWGAAARAALRPHTEPDVATCLAHAPDPQLAYGELTALTGP